MTSTTVEPRTAPVARAALRLAIGVVAAVVASVVLDTVIAAVAHGAGASSLFKPLTPGAYSSLTVLGILGGTAGWALLRRRAANPAALVRWLVPTVLVLSFVPDVAVLVTSSLPHTGGGAVAALMVMHVAVAAVLLTMLARVMPMPRARIS